MIETGFAKGTVIKRPEGADKKRNRRLIGKEYDLILKAMSKTEYPDDVLIVRFAIEQGTRRGEAMALRWHDVDMKRNLLSLL
ncbi:hypothetical protein [Komagataeibacter rhaeticus]|nr:hypothetical protein [Komagataeibacter rhaeticus]KDU95082.1 hypothetical protein GLUCORHAEAF1_10310 [Komagataeibacter rhaeticus AF1]GBQ10248.1 hypothetical protein AA16663_0436 [Komagataeibacter rhaeticus DSM 16663]